MGKLNALLPRLRGRPPKDNRLFLEAVCWIIRTGAPWRDLPKEYGPWKTTYNRYNNWVKECRFQEVLEVLKKDGDHEWHMIDATIVRAHQHASGTRGGQEKQDLGRSSGGLSSKIHAKVDSFGMPLEFIISAGNVHEMNCAYDLIDTSIGCEYPLADRGYDSNDLRLELENRSITPVIPGKSNRVIPINCDKHIYKERNAIERFFCKY